MINQCILIASISLSMAACSNEAPSKTKTAAAEVKAVKKERFFPVTDFIKGEIKSIPASGVNPVQVTTGNGKVDSVWLKTEMLTNAMQEFLTPVIDSVNLLDLYTEAKFEDQTLNTYTFTYSPKGVLPDTMQLTNWDVYINPETGTVKTVYLVKKRLENGVPKQLQLTWQTGKSCKIVTIATRANDKMEVEKETIISWDF